jgi:hypothetical protein
MKRRIGIGDPIEVAIGMDVKRAEIRMPATVSYVDDYEIVAVFADGRRLTVERHSRNWWPLRAAAEQQPRNEKSPAVRS